MLWIALFLPDLPLQVSHRGLIPDLPLVISDGSHQRPVVIAANGPANKVGIYPGMAVAAAQALAFDLVIQHRDLIKEQAAICTLANWAMQFTPTVVLEKTGVIIEIKASLRLFGGLSALWRLLIAGARSLGFHVSMSWAPTPLAAWLLANARSQDNNVRGCVEISELCAQLDPLPIYFFEWNQDIVMALSQLGVTSIGQCRRLPREGLVRRFGSMTVRDLDRALGSIADPRVSFLPPKLFFSKIELAAELDNIEWIKLPIKQLLAELEGYLRSRLKGTKQLTIKFEQGRRLTTDIKITMLIPECFADNFELLINEHLDRTVLKAPIQAVSLFVDLFDDYCPNNKSLVQDVNTQTLAWHQLCERLTARLPHNSFYQISLNDDHRPEYAWIKNGDNKHNFELPDFPRPAWLLDPPLRLGNSGNLNYQGPLNLLTEPERIEVGWWDNRTVSRDYYLASNSHGQIYWVFFDYSGERQWFLHGIFA